MAAEQFDSNLLAKYNKIVGPEAPSHAYNQVELPDGVDDYDADAMVAHVKKYRGQFKTTPVDHRFASQTNQEGFCYLKFNEYLKCVNETVKKNETEEKKAVKCSNYVFTLRANCPNEWVDGWNESIEKGTWPGYRVKSMPPLKKFDHTPFGPETDAKYIAKHGAHKH